MAKIKTLDDFAGAIHKDYVALDRKFSKRFDTIESRMATKVELSEVKLTLKNVQEDVQHINEVMVSKADLETAIKDEFRKSEHGRTIDKLEGRVDRIEEKLGMKEVRPV